ncbi:TNF receptor-associated factor 4-like [Halichondria panicea]|uniref:TNF receptor-associated factor 4-like n=1 Tax=Halichondria panicea TaxID=6063 RepID=UPI00312BBBE7
MAQNQEQPSKRVVGFDCMFLEPPPEHLLQSECPVCLQIIREPHQVTCCGNSFCYSCIQRVKEDNKPCPTCNKEGLTDFPDKRLKRSLYALKVRCSHQKDGCEWTGELGQLDEHLNTDPLPEKQLNGCSFVEIDCLYKCGDELQRRHIQNHQTNCCPKRPFDCEYCHDYESTVDDVTNNHWPVCGSFPVPCPNQCGSNFQRQNKNSHVADECPLTTINCDFHHVGCAVKLPRQDMPEHLRENLLTHISLLASSHAKQQDVLAEQKAMNIKQQAQINEQQDDLAEQKALNIKQYEEIRALRMQLNTVTMVSTPVLALTNYRYHQTNNVRWYSRPVYTHHQGYKICLGIDAIRGPYMYARSIGLNTIKVYVFFMRGEFDDSLTWPFQGEISIQLLNQVNSEQNVKFEMNYNRSTMIKMCSRVTKEERATDGQVQEEKYLMETKYLQNDTLLFQICSARLN